MTDTELPPILYKHPPITEAVIGINFSLPIKQADISSVNKKFHSYYPHYQAVSNVSFAVELSNKQVKKSTADINQEHGHRFSTADMTQLLLLWPSSFSLSQLAPYQGWDNFFDRFVKNWGVWKRVVGFQPISRIGVRYINRIDIPVTGPIIEHEEFLNIYPKLPDMLNPLEAYAIQTSSHLKDIDCRLLLNSAVVPSPILGRASFLLDLDISKEIDLPQNDNDIFDLLQKIHIQKNAVFETCVSNRARELFQ